MARSARDVAGAIRERIPGVPVKKLHKLLYYAQAHHLATFHQPLFGESISAWDMGPVVGQLWKAEKDGSGSVPAAPLDELELNTVGYVLARYGRLSGRELEILTHGERPWQRADEGREPRGTVRIEPRWIEEYFTESDEDDEPRLDRAEVEVWLAGAAERLDEQAHRDDVDEISARLRATA